MTKRKRERHETRTDLPLNQSGSMLQLQTSTRVDRSESGSVGPCDDISSSTDGGNAKGGASSTSRSDREVIVESLKGIRTPKSSVRRRRPFGSCDSCPSEANCKFTDTRSLSCSRCLANNLDCLAFMKYTGNVELALRVEMKTSTTTCFTYYQQAYLVNSDTNRPTTDRYLYGDESHRFHLRDEARGIFFELASDDSLPENPVKTTEELVQVFTKKTSTLSEENRGKALSDLISNGVAIHAALKHMWDWRFRMKADLDVRGLARGKNLRAHFKSIEQAWKEELTLHEAKRSLDFHKWLNAASQPTTQSTKALDSTPREPEKSFDCLLSECIDLLTQARKSLCPKSLANDKDQIVIRQTMKDLVTQLRPYQPIPYAPSSSLPSLFSVQSRHDEQVHTPDKNGKKRAGDPLDPNPIRQISQGEDKEDLATWPNIQQSHHSGTDSSMMGQCTTKDRDGAAGSVAQGHDPTFTSSTSSETSSASSSMPQDLELLSWLDNIEAPMHSYNSRQFSNETYAPSLLPSSAPGLQFDPAQISYQGSGPEVPSSHVNEQSLFGQTGGPGSSTYPNQPENTCSNDLYLQGGWNHTSSTAPSLSESGASSGLPFFNQLGSRFKSIAKQGRSPLPDFSQHFGQSSDRSEPSSHLHNGNFCG